MIWALVIGGVLSSCLGLVVIGLMREVVILRSDVAALAALVTRPSQPSYLGQELPAPLHEALASSTVPISALSFLVFVAEGCSNCSTFLKDLGAQPLLRSRVCVVVREVGSDALAELAELAADWVVRDIDGNIGALAEVRATPMVLRVRDGVVLDYRLGGDIGWVIASLDDEAGLTSANGGSLQPIRPTRDANATLN